MSTHEQPDPPVPPPHIPDPDVQRYNRIVTNLSLAGLVVCPAIALLPPRKIDVFTFGLGLLWTGAADNVAKTYSGVSLWERLGRSLASESREKRRRRKSQMVPMGAAAATEDEEGGKGGKEGEGELQRRLREERMAGMGVRKGNEAGEGESEEARRRRGVLGRIWMGGEDGNWKERRMREEREAMEEGKGYGEVMMEQIREVFRGERKEVEEEMAAKKDDGEGKS